LKTASVLAERLTTVQNAARTEWSEARLHACASPTASKAAATKITVLNAADYLKRIHLSTRVYPHVSTTVVAQNNVASVASPLIRMLVLRRVVQPVGPKSNVASVAAGSDPKTV